jgi:hypothetical protein
MLQGIVRHDLLVVLRVDAEPGSGRHEVQASSRLWVSSPAALFDKDTHVSSTSWISREVAPVIVSGVTGSWMAAAGSSGT